MDLEFTRSEYPTIGAELELQLIDPTTCNLVSRSIPILEECQKQGIQRIKKEVHQSMLEIDSPICYSVKECRSHLENTLSELKKVTSALNIKLATSGTHPFQHWTERRIFPAERYLFFYRKYRWLAKRVTVYGLHVHVGVESGDEACQITNILIKYLPHLLALSSSSPYWGGANTGLASCRIGIMECFPFSGIPPFFSNWKEFSSYYHILHKTKAINSFKDLYWHIRPSPTFGTVEIRICDGMSTLSETMALVALVQTLVRWAKEEKYSPLATSPQNFHRMLAPENIWRAARDGLKAVLITNEQGDCRPISEDIQRLLEKLAPYSRELKNEDELAYINQILVHGSGAERQRKIFQKTHNLRNVVEMMMDEFLLDQPCGHAPILI